MKVSIKNVILVQESGDDGVDDYDGIQVLMPIQLQHNNSSIKISF